MSAKHLPVVNMNGSSRDALVEQQLAVAQAARALADALAEASPHGRDYQTAQPGEYEGARKEHDARCQLVRDIMDDAQTIALHIQDSPSRRK